MKGLRNAFLFLFLFGIVKIPLEQRAGVAFKNEGVINPPPDLGVMENLTQMGAAAALGGLRAFVASITFLQSVTAFENEDWPQVDSTLRLVTRLQPKIDFYWLTAADHMAFDAAAYYDRDETRPTLYRNRLYKEHVERGIEILKQGLQFIPGSGRIEERLAQIYSWRMRPADPRNAGNYYMLASSRSDLSKMQRLVNERMGAYHYAETDDIALLTQAWDILSRQYRAGYRMDGVIKALAAIEKKSGLPSPAR